MKIVVCVKHVPDVTNVQVDPNTGTLVREGVRAILNPFCEYALDQAVHLSEKHENIEIIAVTMGPPQASEALMRCLELGAHRGILVTDRKFAGADTWATAYTIAEVIRKFIPDFNLILTGKQAIDGDTAQVGPEIAEILNLPQITYGTEVRISDSLRRVRVTQEVEFGYEILECNLPALVTISKGDIVRRAPSLMNLLLARNKSIEIVQANDLAIPDNHLGLQGSYTQVVKVFPPSTRQTNRILNAIEADEAAQEIYSYIMEKNFLQKGVYD